MFKKCLLRISTILYQCSHRKTISIVPNVKIPRLKLKNEPILTYEKKSKERSALETELKNVAAKVEEIPIMIGGKEVKTNDEMFQVMPFNHEQKLAKFYYADNKTIEEAIRVTSSYQPIWDRTTVEERCRIWQKAADLMAGKYRQQLNAATMLGQAKTVIQAEIDAAAELIDFFRLNAYFYAEVMKYKPISPNPKLTTNHIRYRGIDGFVAAISPFNFTAIGGNLAYTPVLAGNSVVWKPSDTAILSNWIIYKILLEAGLPPEVVSFVPSVGRIFGDTITESPYLAGINFTGSSATFKSIWKQVGNNLDNYINFPVMIGECGGKNFHFVHPSADVDTVVPCSIRSAFEYSGQKCSACSRMFVPESLWKEIKCGLIKKLKDLKIGDPRDFTVFTSAVIDHKAYLRISGIIEDAKRSDTLQIIAGGECCHDKGYFIEPTIIQVTDPKHNIMCEEIFGPVLAIYVYPDNDIDAAIDLVKYSTNYALTGSVFADENEFLMKALEEFKMTCGNFYINDKSTGSVVGQQPFGGRRMSGTNDKTGGPYYVIRWTNPQSIKETFNEQSEIIYPYMCP